jgi:hypothetical protein
MNGLLEAVHEVAVTLDRLAVRYIVGGSLASTNHGEPRTTQDADLVADLAPQHARPLAEALRGRFHIDEDAVREAIARRSSFNIIDTHAGHKIDVFVLRDRAFSREEMSRGSALQVTPDLRLRMASAEDTILTKLEWYEKGGRGSDRQWRDVLGVMKVGRDRLDRALLDRGARQLGVESLLAQALREAGLA